MKLRLDSSTAHSRPVITNLQVHDDAGKLLLSLVYDKKEGSVHQVKPDSDKSAASINRDILEAKRKATAEKGIEAAGSLLSGALEEIPLYRHLLSSFILSEKGEITKYHFTFESTLEQLNFRDALLLAAECQIIFSDIISHPPSKGQDLQAQYPYLSSFFERSYKHQPLTEALEWTDEKIKSQYTQVMNLIDEYPDQLETCSIYFMTITGALLALNDIKGTSSLDNLARNWKYISIVSPGLFELEDQVTFWYPYSKNSVGKINRSIKTTLNTITYASGNEEMNEQTQTNIAHKFQEIVSILADASQQDTLQLKTNIGYLAFTLKFSSNVAVQDKLEICQKIVDPTKKLGEKVLGYLAKNAGFINIPKD